MTSTRKFLTAAALALGAAGCNREFDNPQLNESAAANEWMVRDYQQDMVYAAVVRQSTLFPHHFASNGSTLNELGLRDVEVLSRHFAANPGRLNVRRDAADDALYAARVQSVRDALTAHGVDVARIAVEDSSVGGDGATAERVVRVLKQDTAKLESLESTRSSQAGGGSR